MKPLHRLQLSDAHELVKAVWLHVVFCIPHVELVQLQKGHTTDGDVNLS